MDQTSQPFRLLILGGTSEASALARALADRADVAPILSFAGRTGKPVLPPIPVRTGGFGGVEGLAHWLEATRIAAVIDATHPFAARISAHAAEACTCHNIPLAAFTRPPWRPNPDDRWQSVADLDAAAGAIGGRPRRVFLTSGRLGLGAFRAAPQHHYLIRSIDPPASQDLPPDHRLIFARGPFDLAAETALMRDARIDALVSKNSGGAGGAKLEAAKALGLDVIMVERPQSDASRAAFTRLDDVLDWIAAHRAEPSETP